MSTEEQIQSFRQACESLRVSSDASLEQLLLNQLRQAQVWG